MEVWNHRGLNEAFTEAETRIREASARSGRDLNTYRLQVEEGFNPVAQQINANPHDAVYADIQRLRVRSDNQWYVGFSEFDNWLMIYEVIGHVVFIRKIAQLSDDRDLDAILADLP